MIHKCSKDCISPFQDRMYGIGMRVMNEMKDPTKARCTVCGTVNAIQQKKKVDNSAIMGVKKK